MAVAPDCTMQGGQLVLEGQIPRVDVEALSYEAFRMNFMLNNQPVVVSNVANGWRASGEWKSADGKPDLAFLKDKFGASSVQVADCSQQHFSDQERLSMTLAEYLTYWEQHNLMRDAAATEQPAKVHGSLELLGARSSHPDQQAPGTSEVPHHSTGSFEGVFGRSSHLERERGVFRGCASEAGSGQEAAVERGGLGLKRHTSGTWGQEAVAQREAEGGLAQRLLYLKDWHFVAEYPGYGAYETPVYFQDDWLNEYLDRYPMQYEVPKPEPANPSTFREAPESADTLETSRLSSGGSPSPELHIVSSMSPKLGRSDSFSVRGDQSGQQQSRLPAPRSEMHLQLRESPLSGEVPIRCVESGLQISREDGVGSSLGTELTSISGQPLGRESPLAPGSTISGENTSLELEAENTPFTSGIEDTELRSQEQHQAKAALDPPSKAAVNGAEQWGAAGLSSAEHGSGPIHTEAADPGREVECADYRFVYMGPAGSWTPCHADVLRSYSWSVNVCGRKRWLLLPPEQAWMLYDRHGRSTVYNVEEPVDCARFPHFSQTRWLGCIQEEGEAVFVPSGWFHQVTNLEDTISINHNWLNGYNLQWAWKLLQEDYKDIVASIEDCRELASPAEFEELCQRNLQLNSGTNFLDFFAFVGTVAIDKARMLRVLANADEAESSNRVDSSNKIDPSSMIDSSNSNNLKNQSLPDVVSELLVGLKCASGLLRELDQHIKCDDCCKNSIEPPSEIRGLDGDDSGRHLVLDLPRDSGLACGPLAIAQAVEGVVREVDEQRQRDERIRLKEVIPWRQFHHVTPHKNQGHSDKTRAF